ncbi:MAG: 6-bladed beta-propeller [Dysgonamonadaceae bacterium]|nr:6-bladed beta-propeller [Dysgonamonadaceae bacterium]
MNTACSADITFVTNTAIYILDAQRAKSLFIYDREGRLKKVIDNIGNGPGEFKFNTYVNSFITINNDDIILDKGNFISDESTNYIRIINKEGDKITELLPVPEFVREITISPRNPLQENRDTILFMPSLSNNIYQIYDKKIEVRYQLDFGKSILILSFGVGRVSHCYGRNIFCLGSIY